MVMGPVVVEEEIDFSSDAESEDEEDKEAAETKTEGGDQFSSQDQWVWLQVGGWEAQSTLLF